MAEEWWTKDPLADSAPTSAAPAEASTPQTTEKWWEADPVMDMRPIKQQLEEGRKLEADAQYEREGGLTHFARSVLSGATLGNEPEFMAEMHDSPLSSPKEVAMSERQRIERFKKEHPYISGAGNALGGLAGLATGGMLAEAPAAAAGAGNALAQLGRAAAPYAGRAAGALGTGAAFEVGRRTIGEGATNFLAGLLGH